MTYDNFSLPEVLKASLKEDTINRKNWNYSFQMPAAEPVHRQRPPGRESGIMRPFIIAVFALLALLLNGYALVNAADPVVQQISQLLPHLFYIPIILASVWYPKRGLLLIGLVVGVSLGMALFSLANGTFNPVILVYAAIYVWVVAILSVFTMEQWKDLSRLIPSKKKESQKRAKGTEPATGAGTGGTVSAEEIGSLLRMLSHEDSRVRVAAIASLGGTKDPGAVQPLISLLGDENRSVREASVRALGAMGGMAVEPLIASLGDGDWHIRVGSAIALRIIGDPRGVDPLIRALSDENRFVRREAAKSLGRIGGRRATEPLISLLGDPDTGVRVRAAAALGKIGDPRAVEPLTRAAGDGNAELQEAAGEALSRLKNTITSFDQ
jgi:HEAT repeats